MTLNLRLFLVVGVIAAAVITMATAALAAPKQGDTRPGWGNGDKNHTHTGPPGQSVRPDNSGPGNNNGNNGNHNGQNK